MKISRKINASLKIVKAFYLRLARKYFRIRLYYRQNTYSTVIIPCKSALRKRHTLEKVNMELLAEQVKT